MSFFGTDQELTILKTSTMISSVISFLSGLSVLLVYLKLTNLHNKSVIKSIFYLNITNLIYSVSNILGTFFINSPQICSFLGSINVYTTYSSSFWLMIIAHVFYHMVKQESDTISVGYSIHVKYLLIGFGLPVIATGIGLYYELFGNYLGIDCTIKSVDASQLLIVSVYAISLPTCLTFVVISGFYLKSLMYLRNFVDPSLAKKICYETVFYPIVFLLGNLFNFVANIANNVEGNTGNIFWLMLVGMILKRLQGLLDAVVYGYNPQVRSEVASYLVKRRETNATTSVSMQIEDSLNSSE